jgi:TM2 domain-containing membrane protein YozV
MSETPNSPGDAEPTTRFDPTAPAPGAADPTAQASDAGPTQRLDAEPTQSLNAEPTQRLNPEPPTQAYHGQPAPPTSGGWSGAPANPPTQYPGLPYEQQPAYGGYPQPGYAQQPAYGGAGYPPGYAQFDAQGRPLSDKSKIVAGVLGIVLGGFGAGRFYTGHTGIAVAQLIVTLVTCGLGHFWGLIDGIVILVNGGTDADGRVLRD